MQIGQLRRPLHVGDRLERLVVDADALGRPPSLLGMLRGDERHRLAVVEDAVDREHRLVLELEAVELRPGDVGVGEHRVHAGHRDCGRDVDLRDPGVCVRAAQRVPPEHPGHDQVARVHELALHLRRCVDPRDELPDLPHLEAAHRLRHVPAAIRTASKIFA